MPNSRVAERPHYPRQLHGRLQRMKQESKNGDEKSVALTNVVSSLAYKEYSPVVNANKLAHLAVFSGKKRFLLG